MSNTSRDANLVTSPPKGDTFGVMLAAVTLAGVLGIGVVTLLPALADYRYAAWAFCFVAVSASLSLFHTILVSRARAGKFLFSRSQTVSEREKWLEALFNQLGGRPGQPGAGG